MLMMNKQSADSLMIGALSDIGSPRTAGKMRNVEKAFKAHTV